MTIDHALAKHRGYDVVILPLGLPDDWQAMQHWPHESGPQLALGAGLMKTLRPQIIDGRVICAIAYNPAYQLNLYRKPASEDYRDLFAERFFLVTAETADSIAAQHPSLFTDLSE